MCASVYVCVFMNQWMCECVHPCVCAAWWTDCQLELTWRRVATPRGCAGLRGGLSLISSIRPPCVMAADPRRSFGCDARPVWAPVTAGSGLTSVPGAAIALLLSDGNRWGQRWNFGWFVLGLIKDTLLKCPMRLSHSPWMDERSGGSGKYFE